MSNCNKSSKHPKIPEPMDLLNGANSHSHSSGGKYILLQFLYMQRYLEVRTASRKRTVPGLCQGLYNTPQQSFTAPQVSSLRLRIFF